MLKFIDGEAKSNDGDFCLPNSGNRLMLRIYKGKIEYKFVHGFADSEKTTIYQYCVMYLLIQFYDDVKYHILY